MHGTESQEPSHVASRCSSCSAMTTSNAETSVSRPDLRPAASLLLFEIQHSLLITSHTGKRGRNAVEQSSQSSPPTRTLITISFLIQPSTWRRLKNISALYPGARMVPVRSSLRQKILISPASRKPSYWKTLSRTTSLRSSTFERLCLRRRRLVMTTAGSQATLKFPIVSPSLLYYHGWLCLPFTEAPAQPPLTPHARTDNVPSPCTTVGKRIAAELGYLDEVSGGNSESLFATGPRNGISKRQRIGHHDNEAGRESTNLWTYSPVRVNKRMAMISCWYVKPCSSVRGHFDSQDLP